MTNRQRQILMAARDRAARVREMWEPDHVWQPMIEEGMLAREPTMRRSTRGSNHSMESLFARAPATRYRDSTAAVH
jgi:hypothetical protein